jgi:c-di-GMP-binding flagellar brake protein YcgR
MVLVKILAHELEVDTPLNFRIYSAAGKLLLGEGNSLRSESQCERLFAMGVFRDGAVAAGNPNNANAENTMLISAAAHLPAKQAAPGPHSVRGFPSLPTGIEQFQLTPCEAQGAPFHVRYVGMIPECALLIATEGETEALKIGMEVDAKVICGRAVYAFRTRVAVQDTRIPHLFQLEYPATIRKHMIRKHTRIKTCLSARLLRNDVVATGFDAEVTNLSASGIGFLLPDATLEIGEHFKISLRLKVDARQHAVMLNCIARNMSRKNEGQSVGAEFGVLPEDVRRVVQAYIFQQATGDLQN